MLAIDDVGAGYSSMSHVLQLHPHFIKIDRSLVHRAHRDPNKLAVLRGWSGSPGSAASRRWPKGSRRARSSTPCVPVGVDLVQGYLLARPGRRLARATPLAHRRPPSVGDRLLDRLASGSLARAGREDGRPDDAADEVTAYLYENFEFLPSVYVERAGVLRFLSGRGQWQVLDGIEPGVGLTGRPSPPASRSWSRTCPPTLATGRPFPASWRSSPCR